MFDSARCSKPWGSRDESHQDAQHSSSRRRAARHQQSSGCLLVLRAMAGPPRIRLTFLAYFHLGCAGLFPWSALITAADFWESQYPVRKHAAVLLADLLANPQQAVPRSPTRQLSRSLHPRPLSAHWHVASPPGPLGFFTPPPPPLCPF